MYVSVHESPISSSRPTAYLTTNGAHYERTKNGHSDSIPMIHLPINFVGLQQISVRHASSLHQCNCCDGCQIVFGGRRTLAVSERRTIGRP